MLYPSSSSLGALLASLLLLAAPEPALAVPAVPKFRQHAPVSPNTRSTGTITRPPGSSVQQVRNVGYEAAFSRHGALAREKAYLKYNASLPAELTAAVTRVRTAFAARAARKPAPASARRHRARGTGSAAALPERRDVEWLTPVQVGSPPQTLQLDLDTASADLWVYSTATPPGEVRGQAVYAPAASNTSAKLAGLTWAVSYGDGSSSKGDVYADTVALGGLAVRGMAVETAVEVSNEFTADSEVDGLMGLGFTRLNTVSPSQQQTFFAKAHADGQLDSYVFTADLKAGAPGTYNFGYIDHAAYTGDIAYTAIDASQGYWMMTASGFAVGNQALEATAIRGIADTGTTLLLLPTAVVAAYYAQVAGAAYDRRNGGWVFACNASLPDFTLGVAAAPAARIVVPGAYINYSELSPGGGTCYGGIQDDADIGFAIFGGIALKAAFVVFEGGDAPRIGWASKDLGAREAAPPAVVVVAVTTVTVGA